MNEKPVALAERIIAYRAKCDMSQRELAKRCNISYTTLWNIEHQNAAPTKLTVAKIERVLNEQEN